MRFAILYQRSNVSNPMSIDPRHLWAALPPSLWRQIVGNVAAVLAASLVRFELVTPAHLARKAVYIRQSTPHQGSEQPGKPAAPIRASPARLRTRMA
jgi:hypothetical protein